MIVVGLTGGIAMGKSEVAKVFESQDIPVFDADREVHRLYDSPEGAALIADLAPSAAEAGTVNRRKLTELVLADPDLLSRLEQRVHAEIRRRRAQFVEMYRSLGRDMVVLDVPLLFETGTEKDADCVVVVSAAPKVQRERALQRPGMTEEKLEMILKRQMPDAEKRKRATHVIETNGSLGELRTRVLEVIRLIRQETHHA